MNAGIIDYNFDYSHQRTVIDYENQYTCGFQCESEVPDVKYEFEADEVEFNGRYRFRLWYDSIDSEKAKRLLDKFAEGEIPEWCWGFLRELAE